MNFRLQKKVKFEQEKTLTKKIAVKKKVEKNGF